MSEIVSFGPEFTHLLEWLPVPAFVRSIHGVIRYMNPALCAVTGVSGRDHVGRRLEEFLPDATSRRLTEEDRRVLAGETVVSESTFQLTNGGELTLFVTKRRARHPEWGDVVVGIGCDMTQRQAAERDETLSLFKHELQNPVSAISGLSDFLLHTTLDSEQRHSIELIRSTANACMDLLADLLGPSRTSPGSWNIHLKEFSLREFLDDVLSPFQLRADARRVGFHYSVAEDVPDQIYSDPLRLRQVLQNLAANALKFTEAGSVEVHVSAAAETHGGAGVQFRVGDTGIGIAKEKLSDIFEPFVQAHDSSSGRYGGRGLGLAIAKRIVSLMNGQIWAESVPTKGSVFYVVIPSQKPERKVGSEGLDLKSALATAGGDAVLMKELADLFIGEYPSLIADLRQAAKTNDSKTLDVKAHALKGAVSNFGARAAVDAALVLEAKGRSGEMEGVDEALARLEEILEPLLVELAAI